MLRKTLLTCSLALVFPRLAAAEEPPEAGTSYSISELSEMSLEELLSVEIAVTSQKAQTLRESAGVLTVITGEEIAESGARDLSDVLKMVPGIGFGVDVYGAIGLGFRGNWAHEAKHVLLIDGHLINEGLFGTTVFGNHFPVHDIKSVEIIRGPGSAMYGGYAELMVIKVTTLRPTDKPGVGASGFYEVTDRTLARRNLAFRYGQQLGGSDGVGVTVSGMVGQSNRSDRTYRDVLGSEADLAGANTQAPGFLNASLDHKGLHLGLIYDGYGVRSEDGFVLLPPRPIKKTFHGLYALASYDRTLLHDKLHISALLSYKRQQPWASVSREPDLLPYYYDPTVERYTARLIGTYDILSFLSASLGGELYVDHASKDAVEGGLFAPFQNGQSQITYRNLATFAEMLFQSGVGNLTAGLRFENHSQFGSSLVPRVAYTKVLGRNHLKLLYSHAFKSPPIENLTITPDLRPERARAIEVEVGRALNSNMFLTANFFDMRINRTLVYFIDAEGAELYRNSERTGTRGFEIDYHLKAPWASGNISYSFYTPAGINDVSEYKVPGRPSVNQAFPKHKVALRGSVPIGRHFEVNPSAVWTSARFGLFAVGADGSLVFDSVPSTLDLNLTLRYKDLVVSGLDLELSGYNLLNSNLGIPQPYTGGHTPLPGMSRSYGLRLSYALPL